MLPYFEQPVLRLGPLTIHAFGLAVAVAMLVGLAIADRRVRLSGLDARFAQRLAAWTLGGGILGAHLFSVLLYFPEKLRDDPWLLLRLWEDISSFGGILGGLAGAVLFFALRASVEERAQRLAYLDAVAFAFPAGLAIGRIGCALAHDHPGTVTTFPLAFSIQSDRALAFISDAYEAAGRTLEPAQIASVPRGSQGFHDLGWYEFLFLALVVVPLFQLWGRRARPGGFYLIAFPLLYLPVRFGIDFLRIADARYAGLTPAQWVAVGVMGGLALFLAGRRRRAES